MPRPRRTTAQPKEVIAIAHKDDSLRNNPTAEMEAVMDEAQRQPVQIAYERRNRNLDPQLVWRGKDEQDLSGPNCRGTTAVHPRKGAPQSSSRRLDTCLQAAQGQGRKGRTAVP